MSMDAGLVGHWKFNEKSGIIANDSSRYRNTGTLIGATHLPVWADKGIKFDGVDDYVDAGNGASLNITGAITIEAWVNEVQTSPNKKIVSKRTGTFMYFLGSDSGNLYAGIGNGTSVGVSGKATILGTGLHHVAFTYSNTEKKIRIFKDGVNVENTTITQNLSSFTANLGIGAETIIPPTFTNFFNGSIDEVRIYNRALSASEIKRHYEATKHNYI